ncbi:hypothetical protein Xentx_00824 [Xenorhabdus thuongxuanensis]|uniref:Uncharacterized protein n=1 Tax=Xenorhabdus thuongxuanensis TaxID=1873484 RepID=A0A1Q5U6M9_9GAMM|nr:hypothetical protein Xentx_00824 [Xenorhabdus thuongxuanensis]
MLKNKDKYDWVKLAYPSENQGGYPCFCQAKY